MERAVARAGAEAESGEVVLLAPAAASFDQYPNFEKRGEDFTARVQALLNPNTLKDIFFISKFMFRALCL